MTYGITPSRLPQEVVDHDIKQVEKLGVEFIFNTEVKGNDGIKELLKKYDAVFVGVGLWYTGNNDLSFIPLFIVLIATFCLNLYKKSN